MLQFDDIKDISQYLPINVILENQKHNNEKFKDEFFKLEKEIMDLKHLFYENMQMINELYARLNKVIEEKESELFN